MREFRFGFSLATHNSQAELVETCRTAEAYGYDIAVAVDHLGRGRTSPFQALLAAAYATERMRVGTYVLNIGFWNPSFLAREAQTTQRLSGGRLELGLGAGIIKPEFDAAGIPWQPIDERMARLTATIEEVYEFLGAEEGLDRPPLLVGGTGERALRVAAAHADIVSLGGILHIQGKPLGNFRLATAAEAEERLAFVRAEAGSRIDEIELNSFVQTVAVTDDRVATAKDMAADWSLSVEELLDSPFALIGTEQEIARRIIENRERFGFTATYIQRPFMDALGPVIKLVHSLV